MEQLELFTHSWWDSKSVQPFWDTDRIYWSRTVATSWLSNPIPRYVCTTTTYICSPKDANWNVHSNIICTTSKLEITTCLSMREWIDIPTIPQQWEWKQTTHNNMDESHKQNVEWKKPVTKEYTVIPQYPQRRLVPGAQADSKIWGCSRPIVIPLCPWFRIHKFN